METFITFASKMQLSPAGILKRGGRDFLDLLLPFSKQIFSYCFHIADSSVNVIRFARAIVVFTLQTAVSLFQIATTESIHLLQARQRVLELFACLFLLIARSNH